MRPPPKLTELPRYPIAGGISLLAIVATFAWWAKMDASALFETAMIRRGELWRLVTSVLLHGDLLHLAFNVYWIWVFGTLFEQVLGPIKTAGLILLFAVVPNALEFAFLKGGIGLSGVGYGFFGLLWVLSSRDERFRDAIDPRTIQVFVAWFFICIAATQANLMRVANVTHAAGAAVGILVGFAITRPDRRFPIVAGIAGVFLLSLCAATIWRPALNLSGTEGYEEGKWGYEALLAHSNHEAVRWFRDAVAYQPNLPDFWLNLGIAYHRIYDKPASAHAFRKAAERGDAEAQRYLGELYMSGDAGLPRDDAQALHWFRKATAQDNPSTLNDVAWTYATTTNPAIRNPKAALECARRAVQLTKDHPVPAYLDTLAEAYYVNDQYLDAVKTEEQVVALASGDAQIAFRMRLEKYRLALRIQEERQVAK